jgi:hypothetical protein
MIDYGVLVEWYTQENVSMPRKTCLIATLSITNPTWSTLALNLGLHGDTPVANHLNHDVAHIQYGA